MPCCARQTVFALEVEACSSADKIVSLLPAHSQLTTWHKNIIDFKTSVIRYFERCEEVLRPTTRNTKLSKMAGTSFLLKSLLLQNYLHSKGSSQGKILNTESNISMLTKQNPVMDGSVLGIPQSGDLDCLGSGIFQAEAEFLVFMSAVEGNPSPLLTCVCFFEY